MKDKSLRKKISIILIVLSTILQILILAMTILSIKTNSLLFLPLLLFVSQIFIFLLLYNEIMKNIIVPIEKLLEKTKAITLEEDLSKELEINTNYEIGELTYQFNRVLKQAEICKKRLDYSKSDFSLTDWLTNLGNKTGFEKKLKEELNRAKRAGYIFTILFIEIDDFNSYIDKNGQKAGDTAITTLAKEMRETFKRAGDYSSRYGSAKFAVILTYTDTRGALTVSEKLQRKILERINSDKVIPFTISIGIYSITAQRDLSYEFIIQNALKILQTAKENGKGSIKSLIYNE